MGEKRKNDGGSGANRKKYKVNNGIIDPSTSGVYATCHRRKEKQCAAEFKELLEEAAEELYGDKMREEDNEDSDDNDDEGEELSIEESLKKELESLKQKPKNKKEKIRHIDLGCECVVFIKTRKPIVPEEIVAKICKDATESKTKNTRFTQKLTPITYSVSATMEEVEKLAKRVLAPHFHKDQGQEPHTFAIKVSARNFNSIPKGDILQKVAQCVGKDHGHKVDLKKYEKLILVECFKNNIGMSVVDDYDKYQKYNLQQIFEKNAGDVPSGDSRVGASGVKKEEKKEEKKEKEEEQTTKSG
ncbi:tRNA acetyltransferase TAN1 [Cyberlindnera fabianii]|uniref:tRNA acetyltransferase TAN1 n=1 Tax=Cyberlindnera fabianii TaxID=36022 RepID=A0A1V2LBC2_CYBFA|nr:tRNA acetyltransferase TAN1 [Cyberlindnera fabianii]